LSHSARLYIGYFQARVLWGWLRTMILLISVTWVVRITGVWLLIGFLIFLV
jgi:hypothetical protein